MCDRFSASAEQKSENVLHLLYNPWQIAILNTTKLSVEWKINAWEIFMKPNCYSLSPTNDTHSSP